MEYSDDVRGKNCNTITWHILYEPLILINTIICEIAEHIEFKRINPRLV